MFKKISVKSKKTLVISDDKLTASLDTSYDITESLFPPKKHNVISLLNSILDSILKYIRF